MINATVIISSAITLLLVTAIGAYSLRRVKTASDFSVGGNRMGPLLIAGAMIGSFVGGGATIGTAELAFKTGFSAWWFTLGGGIACLILGFFLYKPFRASGLSTAPQILAAEYGSQIQPLACLSASVGTFLGVISQVLSIVALLHSMFGLGTYLAAVAAVILVCFYVIFGGIWGAGIIGIIKTVMINVSFLAAGLLAFYLIGGTQGIMAFPSYPWLSVFGRGVATDVAAGFSVIVGVLSTQIFLQTILSARDARSARIGAVISAFFIIPIGLAGVLIGLFMQSHAPHISPRDALPLFILNYMPSWLGGVIWAVLLISAVGTAAGLVLGISTSLSQDIYKKVFRPNASDAEILRMTRILIVSVTVLALISLRGFLNSFILQWNFLSMGLRGATLFFPLLATIFLHKRIKPLAGRMSIALAPAAVILWSIFFRNLIDPLYIGMGVSFLILFSGLGKRIK